MKSSTRASSSWRTLTVRCDDGQQVAVPFDYAEAGHLAHGYATTIHKAQGTTVDRCLVLLDETGAREHVYTALSRGRHGNDVFIAQRDRRGEERHATELEVDPLDALRSVMGRSAAQRLALDQVEPTSPPLDQAEPTSPPLDEMRQERDVLRQRIGHGPPDPGREFRELSIRRDQEQRYLRDAQWRHEVARKGLDKLGPIGRRTHRAKRHELEDRLERFKAEITGHDEKVAQLDGTLDALTPEVAARASWEREYRDDLDQLASLDRHIETACRLERIAERGLRRGAERGLGVEL